MSRSCCTSCWSRRVGAVPEAESDFDPAGVSRRQGKGPERDDGRRVAARALGRADVSAGYGEIGVVVVLEAAHGSHIPYMVPRVSIFSHQGSEGVTFPDPYLYTRQPGRGR